MNKKGVHIMKKYVLLLTTIILAFMLVGCKTNDTNKPGNNANETEETLTGKAKGYGGLITATVTKKGDTITKVTIDAKDETPNVGSMAVEQLPDAIVKANGTNVEAVSGATVSSNGIIAAVNNALDPDKYPYSE